MSAADAPNRQTRRPVDELALRRAVARLQRADAAPWLHEEVARRMAERLPILKRPPQQVIDWWAHLGGDGTALRAAAPRARIVPVEPLPREVAPRPWWSRERWARLPQALAPAAVAAGEAQLVWANMMLHAVADPLVTMRLWHRALAVDGVLMFSTFGPGTLPELRSIYAENGWGEPMAPMVDMHDLGDMLVEAGFAEPVMDQETLRLTWRNAEQALVELRSMGSNVGQARVQGLRTPRWLQRLRLAMERVATRSAGGSVELSFELVYGHAIKPLPRAAVSADSSIALADMRTMLRGSSTRRP